MAKEKWLKTRIQNAADHKRDADQAVKKYRSSLAFCIVTRLGEKTARCHQRLQQRCLRPPWCLRSTGLFWVGTLTIAARRNASWALQSTLFQRPAEAVSASSLPGTTARSHFLVLSRQHSPRMHFVKRVSNTRDSRSCSSIVHMSNRSETTIVVCSSQMHKNGSGCVNSSEDLQLRRCRLLQSAQRRHHRTDRLLGPVWGAWSRRLLPR